MDELVGEGILVHCHVQICRVVLSWAVVVVLVSSEMRLLKVVMVMLVIIAKVVPVLDLASFALFSLAKVI